LRNSGGGLAAKHGVDPGQQLARVERLGEIVVRAHLQSQDAIEILAACGEHDDRHLRFGAHLAAQAEAILARQHHVEDQQVDPLVGHRARHFASVGRRRHVAAVATQIFGDERPRLAVVLNYKDVG